MSMDFAWFHRLNSRERTLLLIIGFTFFILFQVFFFRFALQNNARLQAVLKTRTQEWKTGQLLIEEKEIWRQRDEWLAAHQAKLTNESEANVQLMSQIQTTAKECGVLIQQPEVHPVEENPNYTAVSVSVATTSSWEGLVRFLYAIKKPENFIAIDTINIETEMNDPAQIRGRLKISKWYAPR